MQCAESGNNSEDELPKSLRKTPLTSRFAFSLSISEPAVVLAKARVVPEASEDLLDVESLVQGERGAGRWNGRQLQQQLRSVHVGVVNQPGSGSTQAP